MRLFSRERTTLALAALLLAGCGGSDDDAPARPPGTHVGSGAPLACLPDAARYSTLVYVSPTGDGNGCLSATNACPTIQQGIDTCAPSGCAVLVRHGRYATSATIELRDGVSVYGGCSFDGTPARDYRTVIDASPAPGTPALRAQHIASATTLAGFAVINRDATASGAASIAMAVIDSQALTMTGMLLSAGRGGAGAGGAAVATAGAGENGTPGSNNQTDHPPGGRACAPQPVGNGTGLGGQGGTGMLGGGVVLPGNVQCQPANLEDTLGGNGYASGTSPGGGGAARYKAGGPMCYGAASPGDFEGDDGSNGNPGACATVGGTPSDDAYGKVAQGAWAGSSAGSGGVGSVGSGGGGGSSGGFCVGLSLAGANWLNSPSAGGAGGGGCGGQGGNGGQNGGASIGLLLSDANFALGQTNLIVPAPGGAGAIGGTGGSGGPGGGGGAGGPGHTTTVYGQACPANGGSGGKGGSGGPGGGGAGGNGGVSAGIAISGSTPQPGSDGIYPALPSSGGAGGAGGSGGYNQCSGARGHDGLAGPAVAVLKLDGLAPGQTLSQGQSIRSSAGSGVLKMQSDGNFCLYANGSETWCSLQAGLPSAVAATMQSDGNVCLIQGNGASMCLLQQSLPPAGALLTVRDDGSMALGVGNNVFRRWP